ncbi:hypothetical protein ABZW18_00515 [Streptomyces sp. NPDC004647]|uniref:hypothetical protein n=1 Tax=Streptomyces sp. NPDC004647 TaxID=3154671 RepID=UPI0033A0EFB5
MQTCTCDHVLCHGPGLLAADFQYRHQLRTTEQSSAKTRRRSADAGHMLPLMMRLVTKLEGDAPVRFNYADEASELNMDEETLRARIAWLAEHGYIALDGQVDGLARIWVNPAVAFRAGKTDPRIAAARHQFPYIVTDMTGMAAEQPVHVAEYDKQGWELVYQNNAEQFEDPPRFPFGCPLHGEVEATQ